MIVRLLPLLFLVIAMVAGRDCAADPTTLIGSWVLNKKGSADPEDAFSGKLRHDSYPVPVLGGPGARQEGRDLHQMAYWETIRDGKERNSSKKLKRLGTAYPLVKADQLTIAEAEGGYRLTYDDALPRTIRPNPKGHIYSAKGDELVEDSFGFTLSYWDKDTLVLEADAPDGGKIIERLTVRENPHQLEYVIRVALPVVKQPVELKRLFDPAAAGARGR